MPADTTTDTSEIVVRALTGSSTPASSGPVVSVLTHPGYDLAEDYVEPAGGDWVSEFPIRVRADGKGVVNWTHAIPVGLGQVEHKAIAGDTGELILATGLTDFFQSVGDLNGIDLTEYESPSSRTPIGRYTADECLRAAADAEALVRGGYATGVSIEFRPNGPKGSVEGEGAYWDREVKSPMLPRPGRHFKSWTGLAYAHARRPVNPGCHTVVNDLDVELVAKAIRVMETGKVGSHVLCDRVLKSFREDAPDLLALARAARRSTVTVEGVPPTDNDLVETKVEPGDRAEQIKQVEQRLEAANTRLRTHESAEGGNWRRLKTINNHRRLIAGLTSHLAHLKGEGTATESSLPVPKDLLHSPTAVELANSLGRQIRFNSEQIGTVIGLRRPSLRFPEGGVTVDVDGQDTSMDFRGLHDHMRAGTFRWHRPESAAPPAETPKPEAPADRLVFKNRGQRLKDLSDTPGVFEHVRGAIKTAHPDVDVSNLSVKKLPDRDSADHTVYFVADNQSFHGAGPSVEAATRRAVGKLTAVKQARADYFANQTPAEKEQAAQDAAASAETSRAKWAETRAKFPGLFGQKAFGEDGELDDGVEVKAKSDAWIAWKVRKLIGEGKPRKQAVAIAYSMAGRGEKEAKASPDASELVSLVRGDWFHDNGSPRTRAINSTMVNKIIEKHGVDKDTAESALKEASRYAAADWKRFKETSGEFCPKCDARLERDDDKCNSCGHEYKAYTGPLRASGRLNTNPNVEDEERGDDEPDFEIPGLDDGDDRDTKALRMNGPGGEVARTKLGAAVHNMNLAARDARIKSYAAVEDHAHPTVRYALMAARALQRGDFERAGGAHMGAVREHQLELQKLRTDDPSRQDHLDAIKYHREAAAGVKEHLLDTKPLWKPFHVRMREGGQRRYGPPTGPTNTGVLPGRSSYTRDPAQRPATPFSHRATERAADYLKTGPGVIGRVARAAENFGQNFGRSTVDRLRDRGRDLLAKFGITTKSFEDSGVSDPYEVARIASGLAMAKTNTGRQVKAVVPLNKSPREMKAYHEREADNPRLAADAADRHLRAAEMWERAMAAGPARLGNGRPYMKARTDGFDVPAVALGPDERPPASISALMNFAQLQMDGAEALAYDAQQSDDLMFRTYAKALATQAQTTAATLQKQASAMQQYLNGAANNGGMQKHPLMGMLSTDQNQPGTTTAGDVPPGADGTTTDDADDATANGAQKAFTDDAALDSLFAEPVAVPDNTPEVDADGWLVFKAFPEWKPRRYAMSELRDLPRANTGHANKSATANTTTAVQTPAAPTVEAKADEWANPEVAAKLGELTAQLKKLKQLDEAVQHRQQRGGW